MNYAYYDNFWIYDCSRLRLDIWTSTLSQITKLQMCAMNMNDTSNNANYI